MWLDLQLYCLAISVASLIGTLVSQSKKPARGRSREQATRVPRNTTTK